MMAFSAGGVAQFQADTPYAIPETQVPKASF